MTKADIEKTAWSGRIISVQPRIRLMRSFDERSHSYLGYVLRVEGTIGDETGEFIIAADNHNRLGRHFSKYGITATMSLPITDQISAHVGPNIRGVLLGLVEVYQRQGQWRNAIACLERVRRLEPDDVVVKLSL